MNESTPQLVTPQWLRTVLAEFESMSFFDEMDLCGHIGRALRDNETGCAAEPNAAMTEFSAFGFQPQALGETSRWKTHSGPHFTVGDTCEPDIVDIEQTVLAYWRHRMGEARHPILRARYADLLWDLSRAAGAKPPIEAARTAADSYAAFGPLAGEHSMITALDRLQRGLQIALQIKDERRIECVRDALFELFTRVNHTWGWVNLLDTFEYFGNVRLTNSQRDAITAGLEAHIANVAGRPQGAQPVETLHVAGRLARYYRRLGREEDACRVIRASGQAVERAAAAANAMLGHAWLDDVYRVYRINNLDEDAARVLLAARARGVEAETQMARVTSSVEIDREELKRFTDDITEGGLETAIQRIVAYFLPDLDQLSRQLQEQRRTHPLASMFEVAQMREGQVVGRCGPVDTDPEGALLHAISQRIGLQSFFLARAIDRATERYSITAEALTGFLYESPVFSSRFHGLIRQGIEAYLQGDHLKAVHVLIPQIENALRSFLYLVGLPPNKPRRGDPSTMTEKTLSDILEHEPVLQEYFGEQIMLYLLAFLADPRGHNVRNRLSHGLMAAEQFNRGISDRVLHILLLLGTIRRAEKSKEPPADEAGEHAT
jgi:hypothetical protein